jgi:hypothetical protein
MTMQPAIPPHVDPLALIASPVERKMRVLGMVSLVLGILDLLILALFRSAWPVTLRILAGRLLRAPEPRRPEPRPA